LTIAINATGVIVKKNKILIVAAHPDDEVLGCGGTVSNLIKKGHKAYTLILGEGVTSRDEKRDRNKRKASLDKLKKEAIKANKILGIKDVFLYDFPDNRFDTVAFIDIVKVIERVKKDIKPDIIFTHYENDLNIDHQIVYKAVITATRPLPNETVKDIYSFEVLSSTGWNYPHEFHPDAFFDITNTLKNKSIAMKVYKSELRRFPHQRSIDGIRVRSMYWGMQTGLAYAEAFKTVRTIR